VYILTTLGTTNSFPDKETRINFLQKYYQLLMHQKFPMKEPKLILEGPPDSGKTSWVAPFEGINKPSTVNLLYYHKRHI